MECTGVIHDNSGATENVSITVPVAEGKQTIASGDMLEPLAELQKRINETLSAKIGPNGGKQGNL